MARVFISYASQDKAFAQGLAQDLRDLGHTVWLDEERIRVGTDIPAAIDDGLLDADFVVVVLSPSFVASRWARREWTAKYVEEVERERVMVLPALLQDCEVPALLRSKRYADFRKNHKVGLVQLATALSPIMEMPAPIALAPTQHVQAITGLLTKAQASSTSLAACLAEGITLARTLADGELEDFCKQELAGYSPQGPAGAVGTGPDYRTVEGYLSPRGELNMAYYGWGGSSAAMFAHMRQHPDEFVPRKFFMMQPVAQLEDGHRQDAARAVMTQTVNARSINPSLPNQDILAYLPADSHRRVLALIRQEFTKRLIALLPAVTPPPPRQGRKAPPRRKGPRRR